MERDELIAIQAKVDRCRRLADGTTDPHTARVLRDMADEGEAEIARLLAENAE